MRIKYGGVTDKVISEFFSPTLHPDAMKKVYMPMANTLLDTGDMTMTTIVRVPIADNVSTVDMAMITLKFGESVGIVYLFDLNKSKLR